MSGYSSGKSSNWLARIVHSGKLPEVDMEFSSPDAEPDSKPAEEPGQDARIRRREQVRRAQRTHRDRKATYVKALEHEVAKLRAMDVAHDEQIRDYREMTRRLRDLLLSHNIQIPSDLPRVHIDSPLATIEVVGRPDEIQRIRAHMPTFDPSAPAPFLRGPEPETQAVVSATQPTEASSLPEIPPHLAFDLPMPTTTCHPFGLDSTQVGIDFVLALEHPCLYHHQLPNPELAGLVGTGHELMVLSSIMRGAPAIQVKGHDTRFPTSSKWNVPAIELGKLLSFSEGLDLDGEITPVQAWQRIRYHSKFESLTPSTLETLRESLLSVVQCYGFGAVIDETYFEQMIDQVFG